MARSLWPVPAGHGTTKTEDYRELDAGSQELPKATPIMVKEQAPLSLA